MVLKTDAAKSLPVGLGHEHRLTQVLLNLVGSASCRDKLPPFLWERHPQPVLLVEDVDDLPALRAHSRDTARLLAAHQECPRVYR